MFELLNKRTMNLCSGTTAQKVFLARLRLYSDTNRNCTESMDIAGRLQYVKVVLRKHTTMIIDRVRPLRAAPPPCCAVRSQY